MASPDLHVRVGPFEVTSADGRVRRDGAVVPLQELPFRLLLALVRADGAVVTREELARALWEDTIVEYEAGLNTAVRKLRDALDDDPVAPRFVETIPRRGYRLLVPVEPVASGVATSLGPLDDSAPGSDPARATTRSRAATWGWMAALVGLTAGAFLAYRTMTTPVVHRLLVLPVGGAAAGDAATRASGLTDQFIAHLARLDAERLVVLGPMTSRAVHEAGAGRARIRELATHVLSAQLSEAGLAVSLSKVDDGAVIWSEILSTSPGEAWPAASARWTTAVARGLLGALALDTELRVARAATLNTDAFLAYERGRAAWARFDGDGFAASADAFQAAIDLDARFADAYVGLAEAHAMQGLFQMAPAPAAFEHAIAAARQALTLAPDEASALAVLALAVFYAGADPPEAERLFEQALSRDRGRALTHQWAAGYFSATGQHDRAMALVARARELDPLSSSVNSDLCWYQFFSRDYAGAVRQAEHVFAAFRRPSVLLCGQLASWKAGDAAKEQDLRLRRLTASGGSAAAQTSAEAFTTGGIDAVRAAEWLRLRQASTPQEGYQLAVAAMAAGQPDQAIAVLERLLPERPPWRVFLDVDPAFDAVRARAAFARVARRAD